MLIPRTKLIVWGALLVLPFAAAGATLPGAVPIAVLSIVGFAALVVFDAVRARTTLDGIRVELPALVRLQKDNLGNLEVRIRNETLRARVLRVGFAFPREIVSETDDRTVDLPESAVASRIDWPVRPTRRGQYLLEQAYLEAVSPWGFWAMRKRQPARTELRVYPDLVSERKNVAALFLKRGEFGIHAQRRAGQGRDFEKLREYVPGDSYDEIHWKASAKRGHPVTKVFQVERTQEVYVIIDASRLSAREVTLAGDHGPRVTTALERFVTSGLILGLAAEQMGDQFGLLTFSDRVLSFVRARSGRAHYDACRDRLYTLQPQSVTPDFEEVFSFIRLRLRKRALLIFLTALDDPMLAESFTKASELISRQHLILVNMLQPAGAHPLFGEPAAKLDDLYRQLGGHLQWNTLRELEKVLRRRGVRLAQLDPAKLSAQLIAQHADVKRRQLL